MTRVTIADNLIYHIWTCKECDNKEEIEINPNWYKDNGTPLCECGCDMDYIRTEIDNS